MGSYLKCREVTRSFSSQSGERQHVLSGVDMALGRGETAVIVGPSGSGKTTLLSILGGMLEPSGGDVSIDGQALDFSDRSRLPRWRRQNVGFVFQQSRLLPFLSVEGNLSIVGRNAGLGQREVTSRVESTLSSLGMASKCNATPNSLSGGERQRVAIARALIHRPPLLLADEPTAALDGESGRNAVTLLLEMSKVHGSTLIVVTHDTRIVGMFDQVFQLHSGRIQQS